MRGAALLAAALLLALPAAARTQLRAPMPAPRVAAAAPAPAAAAGSLFAAPVRVATPPGADAAVQALPVPPAVLTGQHGFIVIDLATGRVLESRNADLPLAPASVAKIPTALYAFAHLGLEHRFETRLVADGPVRDGVLQGGLTLIGGGDPELDSDALAGLARQVAARVSRVSGGLGVSHGGWPALAFIDPEQPDRASYNPAVAGLNLNFNRVRLAWTRPKGRLEATLDARAENTSPPVRAVALTLEDDDCACPAFSHAAAAGPVRDGAVEHWRVRRSHLRGEGSVWLPVRTPDLYAGDVFRAAARDVGLTLPAPERRATATGEVLALHRSAPVATMAQSMLRYSTNITAELLGVAASRKAGVPAGDLAASAAGMNAFAARLGGFPAGDPGFRLANHSGLSAASRVSPARMTALLAGAAADPVLGPHLRGALRAHPVPPPPERGARPAAASIRAKTGTLNFTRGLAGYITTPSGRELAFAWFANDLARRQRGIDDEAPDPGARRWRDAAVTFERALLARWIAAYD